MRRRAIWSGLAGVLFALSGLSACSVGDYSCSKAGGKATDALQAEIQALPSTRDAFVVACDSGDPSTVYFTSLGTSHQVVDELLREKGCLEVEVSLPDNNDGRAYECRFMAGKADVWIENDPARGSNTAFISSPN